MGRSIASKPPVQEAPQLHDINTEPEAARYLKRCTKTMQRLRLAGKIQYAKFGDSVRYTRQHIMNYITANEHGQQE